MTPPPVAYLAGPTASGKTGAAIEHALDLGLAVVSCDSMQVYRGIEIGTAQPTDDERRGVPHRLMGVADPREEFHAARFAREAAAAIAGEWRAGRRVLVVGGTGLWMRALREGLFEGPGRDEALRAELRQVLAQEGAEGLHALLEREDPVAAARLRAADHVRVLRAIEVHRLTGRSIAAWQDEDRGRREALGPLPPLVIIEPDRGEIDRRIARRTGEMLRRGWLEEARRLMVLDLPAHAPARKALGYRELFEVLRGERPLADAEAAIHVATRQFARRQSIWFRGERQRIVAASADEALKVLRGLPR